jgi:hypothetical protein
MSKWFEFENGSNPYGVWDYRQDEFFRMICAWRPKVMGENNFWCPEKPTKAYYEAVDYKFKQEMLAEFALRYAVFWSDCIRDNKPLKDREWYKDFFKKYGKRYGLLRYFKDLGLVD